MSFAALPDGEAGMTRAGALAEVDRCWHPTTEWAFGCGAVFDESLTEEYDWGWVFYLVPTDLEACKMKLYPKDRYAVNRWSGKSYPVGTLGIEHAMLQLGIPIR